MPKIPEKIVTSVKNGKCILFLGAMASAVSPPGSPYAYDRAPPSGKELSKLLADRSEYPDEDKGNLQRVSLFFEISESRFLLVETIREAIENPDIEPSPALNMLASLPFPIVITTNYDRLFDLALARANTLKGTPKRPKIIIYNPKLDAPPEAAPLDPREDEPILVKLHGDISKPESLVVTEEDYITFNQKMSSLHFHPIHGNILARLNSWPILFVGYSLRDYNLRLLFRMLQWRIDAARLPTSYSVDPTPDDIIVSIMQHGEKPMINFIKENLWNFIPALHKECMED